MIDKLVVGMIDKIRRQENVLHCLISSFYDLLSRSDDLIARFHLFQQVNSSPGWFPNLSVY